MIGGGRNRERQVNRVGENVAEVRSLPLVVDLDGTLLKSDLLIESFFSLLSSRPLHALAALVALANGKAALKARIADSAVVDLSRLPLNEDFLAILRREKADGRKIYLASASHGRYVRPLAEHLGLFDGVFASDDAVNLAGAAKAAALCEAFGEGGFDYAGDAAADFAVWRKARQALVVNAAAGVIARARAELPRVRVIGSRSASWRDWLRALRVHQWAKNLLIFVPPLAGHRFGPVLLECLVAFFSFSLCASSVYLLNDLVDMRSDRHHPSKGRRPFASGALPLLHGLAVAPVLLATSLALAWRQPWQFLLVLLGYYGLTLGYSLLLKRKMTTDIVTLACLYGIRLVAGSVAAGVPLSPWLAAFSIFLFLSLALVKRCTELIVRAEAGQGDPPGRGYRLRDLPVLEAMAAASGYLAVLVMALYINSPAVVTLYRRPGLLWLSCVILIHWVSRMLIITHRGEMHDDPMIFAATDRGSLISAGLMAAVFLAGM